MKSIVFFTFAWAKLWVGSPRKFREYSQNIFNILCAARIWKDDRSIPNSVTLIFYMNMNPTEWFLIHTKAHYVGHLEFIRSDLDSLTGYFPKSKNVFQFDRMNIFILMIISIQAIALNKRTPGNDPVPPINLWNLRRYTWDSQENFHIKIVKFRLIVLYHQWTL